MDKSRQNSLAVKLCEQLEVIILDQDDAQVKLGFIKEPCLADIDRLKSVIKNKKLIFSKITKANYKGLLAKLKLANSYNLHFKEIRSQLSSSISQNDATPGVENLFAFIAQNAINERASDIHIEPKADIYLLRYRIDGVLRKITTIDKDIAKALVVFLKLRANLQLDLHQSSQDGAFDDVFYQDLAKNEKTKVDFRISTMPLLCGESVVLRILSRQNVLHSLDALEFEKEDLKLLRDLGSHSSGFILICGPTGSGKSTTLYASLLEYKGWDKKILTIEDPIEEKIPSLDQILLNKKAKFFFEDALKSVLRHDPDIIMIGEIRDAQSLDTALKAANTGHLVYSTLHTNDALLAINRFLDMGAKPYALESSLKLIIAQRLMRKLCECKEKEYFKGEVNGLLIQGEFYAARGCDKCSMSGYKGRLLVCEFVKIDPALRVLIQKRASYDELLAYVLTKGFKSLVCKGFLRVQAGLSSVAELKRCLA